MHKSKLQKLDDCYLCLKHGCPHSKIDNSFHIHHGKPILISEQLCDTVCNSQRVDTYFPRDDLSILARLKKIIQRGSPRTIKNSIYFLKLLKEFHNTPRILVIGAGQHGFGSEKMWSDPDVHVFGVDIYDSNTVEIICDAHYLPFEDESFDGVWIQAVIEHVVDPNAVVDEIYRVLASDGIVYSEAPFMQQVHEGRFDFNRFSILGHRYLFKKFDCIDLGGLNGADIALAWSIRYFILSITRSRLLAKIIGIICEFLTWPFYLFVSQSSLFDSASATYFMGKKVKHFNLTHKGLVKIYKGDFP